MVLELKYLKMELNILNSKMGDKVLIVGSGGREHALGWKIAQSPDVSQVIFSPGNAGTTFEHKGKNIFLDGAKKENFHELYNYVIENNVKLVVVGPENPLYDGIVDLFNSRGYNRIFGPTKTAADLEADKFFSFELMNDLGIPQAKSFKCYTKPL